MKLISIKYTEYRGFSNEWKVERFDLQDVNLIVGKNSDGKSRTLNLISGLANLITNPSLKVSNGEYEAKFENNDQKIQYSLRIHSNKVIFENLIIDDQSYLERNAVKASIYNVLVDRRLESDLPKDLPMVTRRDKIQYPYLEDLYDWGISLKHFLFGTDLGRNEYLIKIDNELFDRDPNLKETDKVTEIFIRGNKRFPKIFKECIVKDLLSIGYNITDINYGAQKDFHFNINSQPVNGLLVQEGDRKSETPQFTMSTGMFRALAIIIYFNFYSLAKILGSVLIDDIGEGLDYDRSTKLINLIIQKAKENNIQLLMSTNDRFVMNQVPIEYWQVINRSGGCVTMYNQFNHPDIFKDFEFTGLNNFDFFSTGFFKEGFDENSKEG